jgi:hypothetical protein
MLCPRCKKPTLVQSSNISGWLDSSSYRCTDVNCGYVGRLYITVNPDEIMKQQGNDDPADPPKGDALDG